MRYIFLFLFVVNGLFVNAQRTIEGGVLVGGLYYLGDINPAKQFHSTNLGAGLFVRQNLNKRWAVRANFLVGSLSALDESFPSNYQKVRDVEFNTPLLEIVAQAEFNFLRYKLGAEMHNSKFTPYFATGLGFLLVSNSIQPYNFTIPLSVGMKFALSKKLELGFEWSFRKTFSDYVDNLSGKEYDLANMKTPSKQKYKQLAFFYGKDWYSFAGVFITYKIFQSGSVCKAYDF